MVAESDLWRWLSTLSEAVTRLDVANAVAEVGADAAGASFANLALLDADTSWVRMVHGSSLHTDIATRWAEFPLSARTPLCEAMQTGRAVLLGSPDAIGQLYPNLLADTLAASLHASASLPLRAASGSTLGAAGFAWPQPQTFKARQRRRLELIARLASQALDRALLFERERSQQPATTRHTEAEDRPPTDRLTQRERSVLQLLTVGYTNVEIAKLLNVSLRTIESARSHIRQTLGLRTRAQLVRYALKADINQPVR